MNPTRLLLLALTVSTLSACGGAHSAQPAPTTPAPGVPSPTPPSTPNPGAARPFHMVGVVRNSQGTALAGVRVGADNTVLDGSEVWTTTDAQGRYDLDLSKMPILNSWTAVAHLDVDYNGKAYTLTPELDSTAPFVGQDGAVRNFTLKLVGKSPNGGFYGALFYASAGFSSAGEVPTFGDVELTLTPSGPLIDGTKGQPIVLHDDQTPFEVPQGRYTVTARSLSGQGAIWLKPRGGQYAPSATVDMQYWAGTGMTLEVDMIHPRP
ncbi:carboxypeptidase-like regulatory domain-containing protein [Deinococcus multiflagellatus]|uniref:Carboxypeptidase-like regulatory domain-containing protein n=1 Tax=Deinococcus multiflagellatus TaxID=1656887 RepID=A0ABW1ZRM5_9DEIO|nr:carboxypeptidase-like regulatory domain-containing protein [Deinococcus multiflagellatus]MBZ9714988.1 carboxypeptidase-like regulatory domain-containing protein [Deinococcus multiflagellatus]